jgi:Transposase DDE domain
VSKGSKVHLAVGTLGQLLALYVTPANEQDHAEVEQLARAVQGLTGQSVKLAFVDQGHTGEAAQRAAKAHGIELDVVKHTEANAASCCRPGAGASSSFPGPPASGVWPKLSPDSVSSPLHA